MEQQTNEMSSIQTELRNSKIRTQRSVLGFTVETIAAFHGITPAEVRAVLVDGVEELRSQGMTQAKILSSIAKNDAELIASFNQAASGNDSNERQNEMLRIEVDSLRSRVTHLEMMVTQLMQQQAASVSPPPPSTPQHQYQFVHPNQGLHRDWSQRNQSTTPSSLHPEENWNTNWWQTRL